MLDSLSLSLLLALGAAGFAAFPAGAPARALPAASAHLASECFPDRERARSHIERYLTSSSEIKEMSRATAGLDGADPSEVVLVTDPALCAFITENIHGRQWKGDPDWTYVYYRHPPTRRILTVWLNLDEIRASMREDPEDPEKVILEFEGTLTSEVVTVYSPEMWFLTRILQ